MSTLTRAVLLGALALATPSRSAAQPESETPGQRAPDAHPFDLTLFLDNDNLLLGGWSAITNIEEDGNDFGRTHASGIGVGWDVVPDRLSLRFDAVSQLFTRPLQPVPIYDYATIPVHFHELDQLRLGAAWAGRHAPWHASVGLGVDISNRSDLTFGATGQQWLWHHAARDAGNQILWQYIYTPDGAPLRAQLVSDGSVGATHVLSLTPWAHLRVRADAGARISTLLAACAVDAVLEAGLLLGDRDDLRAELVVRERADLWLDDGSSSLHTTVELAAESAVLRLWMAIHWYQGDARAQYWIHAFPNETMTFGATVRL